MNEFSQLCSVQCFSLRKARQLALYFLTITCSFLMTANTLNAAQVTNVDPAKLEAKSIPQLASKQEIDQFKKLLANPKIQQWLHQPSIEPINTTAGNVDLKNGLRDNFTFIINTIRQRNSDLYIASQQASLAPQMVVKKWQSEMSNTQSLRSITYILIFLFVGAPIRSFRSSGNEGSLALFLKIKLRSLELIF